MKREIIIFTAVFFLLQLCSSLWALPRTAYEAEMAVEGWLKVDPQPLEAALGQEVMRVETYADWIWIMIRIAEKLGSMNARAVEVCTKTGILSSLGPTNLVFRINPHESCLRKEKS